MPPTDVCAAPIGICRCGLSAPEGLRWSSPFGRQGRLHDYVFDWVPDLHMNPIGARLIVLFGFLFVTVSSRLTGEIGSSSNPISGMTVATLLLTCLIFYALTWTTPDDRLAAISVAAIVCVAASNGGTTSQDLKTGYLVGATPRKQQWAILIGALTSALVIGVILVVLNQASTVYSTRAIAAAGQSRSTSAILRELERAPGDPTLYHVWHAHDGEVAGVPAGKYLVDDAGKIKYLVDPGINGKLHCGATTAKKCRSSTRRKPC